MPLRILAVDPGGAHTGIAFVSGDELLGHVTVELGHKFDPANPVDLDYAASVVGSAELLLRHHGPTNVLALEAVTPPSPHLGTTNPAGAIAIGFLIGYLAAWGYERLELDPDAGVLVIDTEGHGKQRLEVYPPALRPTRGQGKGKDLLRHARSAYDVALAARFHHNIATRGRRT